MSTEQPQKFPGLSPLAFQHPSDIQATENLKLVPLLPELLRAISGSVIEKQMRLINVANNIRLGPKQGQHIYDKFVYAADILDLPRLPEIYINNQYVVNATAFGIDNYQITLYAGLVDALTEDELMAVIGHELGHVKCQHMLYKTMAYLLRFLGQSIFSLLPAGTGTLATITLQLAILNWERMAELSCDRAALLVVQDREVVASALSKLAGGSKTVMPEVNLDCVLEQAAEYEDSEQTLMEKIFKVQVMLGQTHPFPIVRAKEIMEWGLSEHYRSILEGDYVHHDGSDDLVVTGPIGKVCPNCKRVGNISAKSCRACATSLKGATVVCTNCNIKVFENWSTCPGCGSVLNEELKKAA